MSVLALSILTSKARIHLHGVQPYLNKLDKANKAYQEHMIKVIMTYRQWRSKKSFINLTPGFNAVKLFFFVTQEEPK